MEKSVCNLQMFAAMVTESLHKTLFVLVICLVIKASWAVADKNQNGFTSISSHLPSASMMRVKREVTDNDRRICNLLEVRFKCSSSFNQDYINAISKCGQPARSDITSVEHSCRQNRDVYCGEHSSYIRHNCTSSPSCSTQCVNALRQAGCCLNGDSVNQYWLNHCNIPMPDRCPSEIQIPNISQDSSCNISSNEYYKRTANVICDNVGLLINGFNQEERCKPYSNYYRDICSIKDNQYCLNNLYNNPSSARLQAGILKAANNCSSSSSSDCSDQCKDALSQVESTVGCCIHALNSSLLGSTSIVYSNTTLWEICEIPVPPKCGSLSVTLTSVFGSLFIVASFVITHALT